MRTDQRRNEDLSRQKSFGGLFVCAGKLICTWLDLILPLMKFRMRVTLAFQRPIVAKFLK